MRPGLFSSWTLAASAVLLYTYPDGTTALAVAEGLLAVAWPLILVVLCCLPALAGLAVPRSWRMWWRRTHDRPSIRAWLRRAVYAADRHRCVNCGYPAELQVDHVRPWSCGGLSSLFNLVTLCGRCNRIKSNYWVWPSGRVTYRPFRDADAVLVAAAILAVERRARRNPLRWYRAAWSIR